MATLKLLKVALIMLFTAHICGSIFYYVGMNMDEGGKNWINNLGIQNSGIKTKYVYSLYWAFVTMITVGYGDITPVSINERILSIFIMIVACGVFGYSLNVIGAIIQDLSDKEHQFRLKISAFSHYMNERKIPKVLQARINRYLEYMNEQEKTFSTSIGDSLMNSLSHRLKDEFLSETYLPYLMRSKFLIDNFSTPMLRDLATFVREKAFAPEDLIFGEKEWESENRKLYFIMRGQIIESINRSDVVIKRKCDVLGEYSFFSESDNILSAKALTMVNVAYLKFEDFKSVIENYPLDYERYCFLRDNLKNSNLNLLSMCMLCTNSTDHLIRNCPKITSNIHFSELMNNVIEESKRQLIIVQERDEKYYRKLKMKFFPLKDQYEIEDQANDCFDDNEDYLINNQNLDALLMNFTSQPNLSEEDETELVSNGRRSSIANSRKASIVNEFLNTATPKNIFARRPSRNLSKVFSSNGLKLNTIPISSLGQFSDAVQNRNESQNFSSSTPRINVLNPILGMGNSGNRNSIAENCFDIDNVKSFKIYHSTENIEEVLKNTDIRRKTALKNKFKAFKVFVQRFKSVNPKRSLDSQIGKELNNKYGTNLKVSDIQEKPIDEENSQRSIQIHHQSLLSPGRSPLFLFPSIISDPQINEMEYEESGQNELPELRMDLGDLNNNEGNNDSFKLNLSEKDSNQVEDPK